MQSRCLAPFFAVLLLAGAAHAQQQTCFPSKFGPNDQVGNLNYVTPEKTLAAAKLVTRGKSYRLGIETNKDTPAFPPRTFALTILQPGQQHGSSLGPTKTTYNDDIIMGWVGMARSSTGSATSASTASTTTATRRPISPSPTA